MEKTTIEIGEKQYLVEIAKTQEEKEQGLQGRESLNENEGMLFDFTNTDKEVSMWMKNTIIPLDIIFINDDDEVIKVVQGIPNDETPIVVQDVSYVLEVNSKSGIKVGDELDLEGPVMKVLAQDGSSQMPLWGGERIYRRPFTKQLIKWVKKAEQAANNPEEFDRICVRIGKKMFKEIKAQDTRPPEYVSQPD